MGRVSRTGPLRCRIDDLLCLWQGGDRQACCCPEAGDNTVGGGTAQSCQARFAIASAGYRIERLSWIQKGFIKAQGNLNHFPENQPRIMSQGFYSEGSFQRKTQKSRKLENNSNGLRDLILSDFCQFWMSLILSVFCQFWMSLGDMT